MIDKDKYIGKYENEGIQPKIGYILIEEYKTNKPKVCEAPRHKNLKLPAYAVIAIQSNDYPDGLVQMVCKDCWKHFDDDLGNPEWSMKSYA